MKIYMCFWKQKILCWIVFNKKWNLIYHNILQIDNKSALLQMILWCLTAIHPQALLIHWYSWSSINLFEPHWYRRFWKQKILCWIVFNKKWNLIYHNILQIDNKSALLQMILWCLTAIHPQALLIHWYSWSSINLFEPHWYRLIHYEK